MKLSKLSLAALVALGAFTTTASATPLEEAIKGVDLSGFVRLRYYSYSSDNADAANTNERYRFSAPFTFKMPVADNLSAVVTVRGEQNNRDNANTGAADFDMVKAYFQYATPEYTVKLGKQEVGTPWTDPGYAGTRGDGVLGLYTGIQGWTLAGAFFANTVNADASGVSADKNNIAVAAAIGSVGPVNAQLWYADIEHVGNAIFGQLDAKVEGFKVAVQASRVDHDALDDNMFWGAKVGYAANGFNVCVGYTDNEDEHGVYTLNADDMGTIKAGKQIYYATTNAADTQVAFIKAGYSSGAYSVGAGYVDAEIANADADEFYVDASYAYSKNFKASMYYSVYDATAAAADDNELRVELKYSF